MRNRPRSDPLNRYQTPLEPSEYPSRVVPDAPTTRGATKSPAGTTNLASNLKSVTDAGYRFDLKGSPSGDGTLPDPYLRGIHDSEGTLISGTTNDDGGMGDNSRVEFTATGTDPIVDDETVTYYVSAGADGDGTGTYLLSVEEVM